MWNIAIHGNVTGVRHAITIAIALALNLDHTGVIIISINIGSLIVKFGTWEPVVPQTSAAVAELISSSQSALNVLQSSYQQLTGSAESLVVHGATGLAGTGAQSGEASLCSTGCILAIVLGVSVPSVAIIVVVVLHERRRRMRLRQRQDGNEPTGAAGEAKS
jgi:hypothetical protein